MTEAEKPTDELILLSESTALGMRLFYHTAATLYNYFKLQDFENDSDLDFNKLIKGQARKLVDFIHEETSQLFWRELLEAVKEKT